MVKAASGKVSASIKRRPRRLCGGAPPGRIISTTTYNGQFSGPLLRFKAGQEVIVDIRNDTDTPEQLHWHGQFVPDAIDGAAEERTPYIPAHGMRREVFVPGPSGLRCYHTAFARCHLV